MSIPDFSSPPEGWTPEHDASLREWQDILGDKNDEELQLNYTQATQLIKEADREHELVTSIAETGAKTITTLKQSSREAVRGHSHQPIEDFLTSITIRQYAYRQYLKLVLEQLLRHKKTEVAVKAESEQDALSALPISEKHSA